MRFHFALFGECVLVYNALAKYYLFFGVIHEA